jgi:hypothetical protein
MAKNRKKVKSKKIVKENPNSAVEKQFFWLVGIIIVLIVGFVFVPVLYHQIFEKFEYGGVKFEKIREGQLTFYHGQFPIIYKETFYAVYNIYLRHYPRENKIPLNTNLSLSKKISISLNEGVTICEDVVLGQMELGKFFGAFPFVNKNITTGFYNASTAKENGLTSITCKNATKDHTVLVIQKSETPSIELGDKENCFVLNIGNCEYLETVERYIIGAMAQINEKPLD